MTCIQLDNIVTNKRYDYKTKSISEFDKSIKNHKKSTIFTKYT